MHSILATMIMYYEERFIAHEMDTVLSSMRDAYAAKYGKPSDDIHGVFIDWGRRINTARRSAILRCNDATRCAST